MDDHNKQLKDEAAQWWGDVLFGTSVVLVILALCVVGHAWVSRGL